MTEKIVAFLNQINGILWGTWFMAALLATGVFFLIGTRFLPFRKFGFIFKETIGKSLGSGEKTGEGTLTPLQAATSALASSVGVGSIVGVLTAIASGGPGALFWMWMSAVAGMATKYAEILLSIEYREKNAQGNWIGGPAFYMKKGVKYIGGLFAFIFSICMALNCLGGCMVQSNSIALTVQEYAGLNPVVTGIILMILVAVICLRGIKALGKTAEKLVPVMGLIYIGGGLIVVLFHITSVPAVLSSIFSSAFSVRSALGGVGGYTIAEAMRYGIARGLYSNEAGLGSAPIAHATAVTDHPARQAMWGVVEVFIVSIIICTVTGISILVTGMNQSSYEAAVWSPQAFDSVIPGFRYVVGLSLILFAYTTIIAIEYYGESMLTTFISPVLGKCYKYIFVPFIIIGAIGGLSFAWGAVDMFCAIQAVPNLISLVILSPVVFRRTREFFDHGNKAANSST